MVFESITDEAGESAACGIDILPIVIFDIEVEDVCAHAEVLTLKVKTKSTSTIGNEKVFLAILQSLKSHCI